jgi:hypothetical protein
MTNITVPSIEKTYLGTFDKAGIITWKLKHIEYSVHAILAVTLRLSITVRNFPKLPTGLSMASKRPPTLPAIP